MTACCPTCRRPVEDELVRSTPTVDEAARDLSGQWHADLAELVALVRSVVLDDERRRIGEWRATGSHARFVQIAAQRRDEAA